MQKLKRFAELVQKDPEQNYLLHNIIGIYDPAFYTRYGVHAYLFGGAIAGALAAPRPYMIYTRLVMTAHHSSFRRLRRRRPGHGRDGGQVHGRRGQHAHRGRVRHD